MLAIDSNLVVRYLTGDHPKQSALATECGRVVRVERSKVDS